MCLRKSSSSARERRAKGEEGRSESVVLMTFLPSARQRARRGAQRSLQSLRRKIRSRDEPMRACARALLRRGPCAPSRARAPPRLAALSPLAPKLGPSLALLGRTMTTARPLLSPSASPVRGERSNSHQSPAPRDSSRRRHATRRTCRASQGSQGTDPPPCLRHLLPPCSRSLSSGLASPVPHVPFQNSPTRLTRR